MPKTTATTGASPAKAPPSVPRLTTVSAVRRELAALYKDARQRRETPQNASKLAYILKMLSDIIATSDVELKLKELERRMQGINDNY